MPYLEQLPTLYHDFEDSTNIALNRATDSHLLLLDPKLGLLFLLKRAVEAMSHNANIVAPM